MFPQTFPLLVLILEQSDEDAKLKRSNQIVDNLLNILTEHKIIDTDPTYTSTHLLNLLFALQPGSYSAERFCRTALNICSSYRGVSIVVYYIVVVNIPQREKFRNILLCSQRRDMVSWLPLFTPFVIFLLCRCSEHQLLEAIKQNSSHVIFSDNEYGNEGDSDPLFVSVVHVMEITPTRAFVKYVAAESVFIFLHLLFQFYFIISVSLQRILLGNIKQLLHELVLHHTSADLNCYEFQSLSELEVIILYITKSGSILRYFLGGAEVRPHIFT